MTEKPLFVIRKPHTNITGDDIWRAFQQLSPPQKQQFLLLRDNASAPFATMEHAFAENSFNLATPDGLRTPRPPAHGLFLLHSRFNHSCLPNAKVPTTAAGVEDVTSVGSGTSRPERRSPSRTSRASNAALERRGTGRSASRASAQSATAGRRGSVPSS